VCVVYVRIVIISDRLHARLMQMCPYLCQLGQGHTHLLGVTLGLGLNGNLDHGLWELHALQHDGLVKVAQGITCAMYECVCMYMCICGVCVHVLMPKRHID